MYIGSVRFFKHLIIGIFILGVLSLLFLIYSVLHIIIYEKFNKINSNIGKIFTNDSIIESSYRNRLLSEDNKVDNLTIDNNRSAEVLSVSVERNGININSETEVQENTYLKTKPYQFLFPELYAVKPSETVTRERTIYLTFDDGPSHLTDDILNTLKTYNIKATFFVVGKTDDFSVQIMKRIIAEGHTIGVHTYTHEFEQIYASVSAYLEDFNRIYEHIYKTTGIKSDIFRFPGGSINDYNKTLYKDIISEMSRRGFTYYDWNVDAGDSFSGATTKSIVKNVIIDASSYSKSIVLLHDSAFKTQTLYALETIIKYLKNDGYEFDKLTNKVKPIIFDLE